MEMLKSLFSRGSNMKLTMLGTGNALVTECYNTCFVISGPSGHFLVDGGGGNLLLQRLKGARINWKDIREIFVTHKHVDHLLGIIWMVRMICQSMREGEYDGEAYIYAHDELTGIIREIAGMVLQKKETDLLDRRLHLVTVADGQEKEITGRKVTFFDIHSTKAKQFGFRMELGNGVLACCGDEPYNDADREYVQGCTWLLHEAFCAHFMADVFHPYEKHHSTVKDACENAERLGIENLVLYHTEDRHLEDRKALYLEEGRRYFHGNIYIPDDLEVIRL